MPRSMSETALHEFEATVVRFCEIRAEYRRRKTAGNLGRELEQNFVQALNALEIQIERMRNGDELAQARTAPKPPRAANMKAWRMAQ